MSNPLLKKLASEYLSAANGYIKQYATVKTGMLDNTSIINNLKDAIPWALGGGVVSGLATLALDKNKNKKTKVRNAIINSLLGGGLGGIAHTGINYFGDRLGIDSKGYTAPVSFINSKIDKNLANDQVYADLVKKEEKARALANLARENVGVGQLVLQPISDTIDNMKPVTAIVGGVTGAKGGWDLVKAVQETPVSVDSSKNLKVNFPKNITPISSGPDIGKATSDALIKNDNKTVSSLINLLTDNRTVSNLPEFKKQILAGNYGPELQAVIKNPIYENLFDNIFKIEKPILPSKDVQLKNFAQKYGRRLMGAGAGGFAVAALAPGLAHIVNKQISDTPEMQKYLAAMRDQKAVNDELIKHILSKNQ